MSIRMFFRRILGLGAQQPATTEVVVRPAGTSGESQVIQRDRAAPLDGEHLLGQFRDQLSTQAHTQAHLDNVVASLSTTLNALPQLARQQGQVLDVLVEDAARARHRDQTLERSLVHLSEGSDRQTQVLGLIQQQLDLNHEVSVRVAESLRETAGAISTFAATSERQSRALELLAQSTQRRVAQSDRLEKALQFWLAIVGAICMLALVYAIWAATRGPVIIAVPAIEPVAPTHAAVAVPVSVTPPEVTPVTPTQPAAATIPAPSPALPAEPPTTP